MYRKVRIKMPKAQSGLEVRMKPGLGFNSNQLSWPAHVGEFSEPELSVRRTLEPVEREEANLEAEKGETAVTNLNADGIPEQYYIGGERHHSGGTPLNLPNNSYIFSRDKSMKITDKDILEQFGITSPPRGGVTPADIAKRYDLNKFKKILLDKNTDKLSKETAELMIANYSLKLGKLALIQESMKGYPKGIPYIAMPYLESVGIDPEELLPTEEQTEEQVMGEQEEPFADEYQRGGGTENRPAYHQSNPGYGVMRPGYTQPVSRPAARPAQRPAAASPQGDILGGLGAYVKPPLSGSMDKATDIYDPRLSDDGNAAFNNLRKALTSNPQLLEKFREQMDLKIKQAASNGSITEAQARQMLRRNEDPQYSIGLFLKYQKQNYFAKELREKVLDETGVDIFAHKYQWDRAHNAGNRMTSEFFKRAGFKDDELVAGDIETGLVQAGTQALLDISISDPEYGKMFRDMGLNWQSKGTYVDPGNVSDPERDLKTISAVDTKYGNNTIDITLGYNPKKEEAKKSDGITARDEPPIEAQHIEGQYAHMPENTPWWLQDVIKTAGAFGDFMRVKRYMPWQATPAVDYMEPTFYSPERELAANAEQLAIGADAISAFGSPQAMNARYSQMSGKAAAAAADILGRYNNQNVAVANEAEKFNVQTFNEYAANRASSATSLFDKVTVANQQFDNAKNQARENLRDSFIDAITNRAQTAALNTMYPNYAVNPATGGTPLFRPGWGKPPANKPPKSLVEEYNEIALLPISQKAKEDIFKHRLGLQQKEEYRTAKEEEEDLDAPKVVSYPGGRQRNRSPKQ